MNNQGFTLVELLAVIIILSLLTLIASTAVTKSVKDSKQTLYDSQIKSIKSAAEAWGADNMLSLPDSGACKYITLGYLKEYGLLDSNIVNPKNNQTINDDLKIKITTTRSTYGTDKTTYEVNPANVNGCKTIFVCNAVDSSTRTTGNVPSGNYDAGDEYICDPGDGTERHFFVLEKDTPNNKVSLIMDRNIGGTVEWIDQTDYVAANADGDGTFCENGPFVCNDEGPITAQKYLSNQTSTWKNVEVSIPTYNQLYNVNNSSTMSSTPWLYDYLKETSHAVSGLQGYWTSDPYSDQEGAYAAHYYGGLWPASINSSTTHGVRPVIKLSTALVH